MADFLPLVEYKMVLKDHYDGKKRMEQAWRWYGVQDPVPLSHIKQAGATGVVSALHFIPNGEIWPIDEIRKHQQTIAGAGLTWSVVESVPVHEDIKQRTGNYKKYIDNYKQTLENLGQCGIRTVCYNFMPVLDWTRTDLSYSFHDGSEALVFTKKELVAFDVFLLKRPGAKLEYTSSEINEAESWLESVTEEKKENLVATIIAGLPGSEESYTVQTFQHILDFYADITPDHLREHLYLFLEEVIPVAELSGITLTIHPDDPPCSLFGLPRVMGSYDDFSTLFDRIPSKANQLCFCTGSLEVGANNDVVEMVKAFRNRIGFVHLRNTLSNSQGDFMEADHLSGDTDMYEVVKQLCLEQQNREYAIPFRPDHGHKMLDDLTKKTNPGYSAIGRLRGLAELRGLELGILRSL